MIQQCSYFTIMDRYLTSTLLFLYGALVFCTLSVYAGIYMSDSAANIQLHDTYLVIASPHVMMILAVVFVLFSGIYLLFEKILRKPMSRVAGQVHFFISFVGALIIFFPNRYEGIAGMPRRYYDYSAWQSYREFEELNVFISVVTILVLLAQLLFAGNILFTLLKKKKRPSAS